LDEDLVVEVEGGYMIVSLPDCSKGCKGFGRMVYEDQHVIMPGNCKKLVKKFQILRKQCCHDLKMPSSVLRAVVVRTKLSKEHGSPLYSVAFLQPSYHKQEE